MGAGASSKKKRRKPPKFIKNDTRTEKQKFIDKHGFDIAIDEVEDRDVYMVMGDMMVDDNEILEVEGQYRKRKFKKWQMAQKHYPPIW